MAKILLVADSLKNSTWPLVRQLCELGHEVAILSSEGEVLPEKRDLELLTPFKDWSLSEALRVLPLLWLRAPEIIHLLPPQGSPSSGRAYGLLAAWAKADPRTRLIASQAESVSPQLTSYQLACTMADLMTLPTARALKESYRQSPVRRNQKRRLLSLKSEIRFSSQAGSMDSLTQGRPWILLPQTMSEVFTLSQEMHLERLLHVRDDFDILIAGGWGQTPSHRRKSWLSRLENSQMAHRFHCLLVPVEELLQQATRAQGTLWLRPQASLQTPESALLEELLRQGVPVALSEELFELLPLHHLRTAEEIRKGRTCLSLLRRTQREPDLHRWLSSILSKDPEAPKRTRFLPLFSDDAHYNHLNRLYEEVLSADNSIPQ